MNHSNPQDGLTLYQRVMAAQQRQAVLDQQRRQAEFVRSLLWSFAGVTGIAIGAAVLIAWALA